MSKSNETHFVAPASADLWDPNLLDQFAMAAMNGILANGPHEVGDHDADWRAPVHSAELAREAYGHAQAMLAERERLTEPPPMQTQPVEPQRTDKSEE